jgi:hypothetical protein
MARIIDLKKKTTSEQADSNHPVPAPAQEKSPSASHLSWSGVFEHRQPNTRLIFIVSMILFTVAASTVVFQKNIITAIFFALLGGVLLLNSKKKPADETFNISSLGIRAGEKTYKFSEIKSFWIEYDPALGIKELSLQLKKWHEPYLKIVLAEENPVQLRLFLLDFIAEVEHQDTIVEVVSRKLGL